MAKNGRLGLPHFGALGTLACSLFLVACGGDDNDSGGSANTGGATGSGGGTSTGGSTGETGGGTSTGGSTGETGGSTSTGGSTGSGGASAGEATFACMIEGDGSYSTCIEYTGSASNIEQIRDASGCADQGGTELDACPAEDAGICALSVGEMTNSTYYYGITADDVETYSAICEATGGTFTAP